MEEITVLNVNQPPVYLVDLLIMVTVSLIAPQYTIHYLLLFSVVAFSVFFMMDEVELQSLLISIYLALSSWQLTPPETIKHTIRVKRSMIYCPLNRGNGFCFSLWVCVALISPN